MFRTQRCHSGEIKNPEVNFAFTIHRLGIAMLSECENDNLEDIKAYLIFTLD